MSKSAVAVVTGVSSGIGRVTAQKLVNRGCRVFGTVRSLGKASPLPGVELVEVDVREDISVQHGIQSISDRAGRIDVLVNSAGMTMIGAVEESATSEAVALFDTNVLGILRTTRAVLPHMRAQSRIAAYDLERDLVSHRVARSVGRAPEPDGVADTIIEAALGPWRMRRTPAGQASLLSTLRRFMPAGPVDASLRKAFGLA